jgi:hypothetical protein
MSSRLGPNHSKEMSMSDPLFTAAGIDPAVLSAGVTLATPLTLARISGPDQVAAALRGYATLFAPADGDLRLQGEELSGTVLTTEIDTHMAQILALTTYDTSGRVATIDLYGRPWPYMALVRDRLAQIDPSLADPDPGSGPYVPDGPGRAWVAAPPLPPFSEHVSFLSPILTAEATGKAITERILDAAGQCYGEPKFRAVLQADGQPVVAAVFDGTVNGHALQLTAIFTLDAHSEVDEIRIFSRPWPVTAYFRRDMHQLLKEDLGPEFWQGPDPDAPLPMR